MSCKIPSLRAVFDSPTLQSVAAGGVISLPNVTSNTKCLTASDGTIAIRNPGTYKVSWNVTATANAAGPVEVQLYRDGSPVPGSHAAATAAAAGNLVPMSASALVTVECCGSEALALRMATAAGVRIANVAIEKID